MEGITIPVQKLRQAGVSVEVEALAVCPHQFGYDPQNNTLTWGLSGKGILFWLAIGIVGLVWGGGGLAMVIWALFEGHSFHHRVVTCALLGLGFGGTALWILLKSTKVEFEITTGRIRTCGIVGLFEKNYTLADLETIELHIDNAPMQGAVLQFALFGYERLKLDYRAFLQKEDSAAMLRLAVYLADKLNKPLLLKGFPVRACKEFLSLYADLSTVGERQTQNL
jgi:hypothetical protein